MMSYYDIILGLIPLTLFGISGFLLITGMPSTVAVPAAALVSVGLIGHAMFGAKQRVCHSNSLNALYLDEFLGIDNV